MKTFIATALLLAVATGAAAQTNIAAGHYCMREPIGGEAEPDEVAALAFVPGAAPTDRDDKLGDNEANGPVGLGLLGADVDIEVRGGQTYVTFSNYMPDNGQIVRAGPVVARGGAGGRLEFTFEDNWRTAGRGTITPQIDGLLLTIDRTAEAATFAGQYAERQYGEFKLRLGVCPAYR